MKLGENNYLIRQSSTPSFMRIGQKLWIFYKWPIFECACFFFTQTLSMYQWAINKLPLILTRLKEVLLISEIVIWDELYLQAGWRPMPRRCWQEIMALPNRWSPSEEKWLGTNKKEMCVSKHIAYCSMCLFWKCHTN